MRFLRTVHKLKNGAVHKNETTVHMFEKTHRYHFRAFRWTLLAIAVSILELLFEPQHYPIADFLFVSIGIGALLAARRVFMMFKITLRNSGIL